MQVNYTPDEIEKFKSDLLTETNKRYKSMQGELDEFE